VELTAVFEDRIGRVRELIADNGHYYTVINSEAYPTDGALPPKNLTFHFSHQYLQTQSVEQAFSNKNSFFIKRGVKNISFIRPIMAEISRILNVK
jgi:hypothetical protein